MDFSDCNTDRWRDPFTDAVPKAEKNMPVQVQPLSRETKKLEAALGRIEGNGGYLVLSLMAVVCAALLWRPLMNSGRPTATRAGMN